jgi:hypothetical protein
VLRRSVEITINTGRKFWALGFIAMCHNPTCPLPNRRDDAVTFHDGAAIGMGEIPDHYEDAVVIPLRGYPALWRRQVGEKSNVTPHAPIAP